MHRLLVLLLPLAACTDGTNPMSMTLATASDTAAYTQRRAAVELYVKTHYAGILNDIASGGGPELAQAMEIAGVPPAERPARTIQLRADLGLYQNAPGPLVSALMLYAS